MKNTTLRLRCRYCSNWQNASYKEDASYKEEHENSHGSNCKDHSFDQTPCFDFDTMDYLTILSLSYFFFNM